MGEGDPKTDILSHVRNKILKPFEWLWWKMFPQSRCHNKTIQRPQEVFAPSLFIPQRLTFCMANSPSDAISMKASVELVDIWPKVESMPLINGTLPKALIGTEKGTAGPHFDILPTLCSVQRFQMYAECSQLLDVVDKRLTVIREWQGDHPVTSHPTSHDTKEERIRQWSG